MQEVWLNIGCGKKHIPGFVNMDIVQPYDRKLDARKGLPYPDGSVAGIYSEHFFEHLTQAEGLRFLRECRRVLKPGGRVRVAMPDLDEIVQRYNSEDWRGDGDMFKLGFDWVANRCEMLNIAMREWGHQHVYNEEELVRIARHAGLESMRRYPFGVSDIPQFAERETRNSSKLILEFSTPKRTVEGTPLVSVLIPAYRAAFFRQALESALAQTYQQIEVIVCDDSEDDAIAQIVDAAAAGDERVLYVKNTPRQGGLGNYLKCFATAKGEFIKFLNDDDLLMPDCIEAMMEVFRKVSTVTLVTSSRQRIDAEGRLLPPFQATSLLTRKDLELEGGSCANALVACCSNFIGEPTTAMFRKADLAWVTPHFMAFGGMPGIGAGDVAMWLNLLGRGNAYYLAKPLSQFRVHELQRQNEAPIRRGALQSWRGFVFHGCRLGLVNSRFVWRIKSRSMGASAWRTMPLVTTVFFRAQLSMLLRTVISRYVPGAKPGGWDAVE